MAAEDVFSATCLTPRTGATIRRLADLGPSTLSLMHGPSVSGNGAEQLTELARQYDERLGRDGETYRAAVQRPEVAKIT
jgi:hypothetical protein